MLLIAVSNEKQTLHLEHAGGLLEFGRGPQRANTARCTIDDAWVSRDHLIVEELSPGRIRLQNLSQRAPVDLGDGTSLGVGETRELAIPLRLVLGQTTISVTMPSTTPRPPSGVGPRPIATEAGRPPQTPQTQDTLPTANTRPAPPGPLMPPGPSQPPPLSPEKFAEDGFQTIALPVGVRPGGSGAGLAVPSPTAGPIGESPTPAILTQWMETILALQRSGGEAREFHEKAARALVNMIGLDVGLVILYERGNWKVVARAARDERDDGGARPRGREFSQTVLRQVLHERRTFFQDLGLMRSQESLQSVDAVVVSPIFRLNDELAGVLYGVRLSRGRLQGIKITALEAQLVQVLAAAAGANLARTEATKTRVQFEQFFSPELVRELEHNPRLLEGQKIDVTILMSDLRGFSTLSERLGPEDTCRLVRDVMERQSVRIIEQGGTIVSYLGDGILAMWNAPGKQDDHAVRACRAALAIQREVPALSAAWQGLLGGPVSIGVGINTGAAQVGNTGSTRKFTYGPLGNSVNLASRVEGATKYLHTPILITGSTRAQIGDQFVTRRLCKVRVVGIAEPVDLYELYGEAGGVSAEWLARRDVYEAGLAQYESRQWFRACHTLLPLLESAEATGQYDHASLKLMKRCWACLEAPPEPFEPVLELTSK